MNGFGTTVLLLFLTTPLAHPASQPLFPTIVVDVPGRPPSMHYSAEVWSGEAWMSVYVFETTSKEEVQSPSNGYFRHLTNWTTSWVSSQLTATGTVLLRVKRKGNAPIAKAAVHPRSSEAVVVNISATDGVIISVSKHARIAIDFDGEMDETDTGPSYSGPPVHSFCWFVDEEISNLPDPSAPSTIIVQPGDEWPNAKENSTVIFAPGVHRATLPFTRNWTIYNLTANTRYFFCAGSIVHSALHGGIGQWGQIGIIVDGYGVLSGEEMWRADDPNNDSPQGIVYSGVQNSSVRGVTLIDFPNHHIILGQFPGDELRNVKVLGWRSNGDGVHVFSSWKVSDLFLRTQDDSFYLTCGGGCSASFERITTWNDANGVAFLFSPGGGDAEAVTLRDSDSIYSRTSWYWWGPNTVFVNRGDAANAPMSGVVIDNVRVEDTLPAFNPFRIELLTPEVGASFHDVTFANIWIANFSTIRQSWPDSKPLPLGIPNTLFAVAPAKIYNVAFNNVTIGGIPMRNLVSNQTIFNISIETISNVTIDGIVVTELI